jgi:hypothetical protein
MSVTTDASPPSLARKIVHGVLWTSVEAWGQQVALFAIFIVLALGLTLGLASMGAFAQAANTATIQFSRPAFYGDGTTPVPATLGLSYNVYQAECPVALQGTAPSQTCPTPVTGTKVGTITTTTGSITAGLQGGRAYCFRVTSFLTGQEATTESARSNEACKSFATPGTVTITVS